MFFLSCNGTSFFWLICISGGQESLLLLSNTHLSWPWLISGTADKSCFGHPSLTPSLKALRERSCSRHQAFCIHSKQIHSGNLHKVLFPFQPPENTDRLSFYLIFQKLEWPRRLPEALCDPIASNTCKHMRYTFEYEHYCKSTLTHQDKGEKKTLMILWNCPNIAWKPKAFSFVVTLFPRKQTPEQNWNHFLLRNHGCL